MKKSLFIVGNWKSNKTVAEAKTWLQQLAESRQLSAVSSMKIILCVPFTLLSPMKEEIARLSLPIALAAQDVSPFPSGAYTGEVSARMIQELADWVIVGHPERRKYFGETEELLVRKVYEAKDAGLSVIYCVSDEQANVPEHVDIVAYEPIAAVGTGKPDAPDHANRVMAVYKQKTGIQQLLYGGSVTAESIQSFISQVAIDGVLVGKASFDPQSFSSLIHASQTSA